MRTFKAPLIAALVAILVLPSAASAHGKVTVSAAPTCSVLLNVADGSTTFELDFPHPTISNATSGYAWLLYGAYDQNIGWTGYSIANGQYDWFWQNVTPTASAYWTNYQTGATGFRSGLQVPDSGPGKRWVYTLIYWPDGHWQSYWSNPVFCSSG